MNDVDARAQLEGPGLLESVRQYFALALATVIVFAAIGVAFALASPKSYSTTSTVGLVDPTATANSNSSGRYTAATASFVSSDTVLARALTDHNDLHATTKGLRGACGATASIDGPVVYVSCTGTTPQEAADRTNAVATALTETLGDQIAAQFTQRNKQLDTIAAPFEQTLANTKAGQSAHLVAQQALTQIANQRIQNSQEQVRLSGGVSFNTRALVPAKSGTKVAALDGGIGAIVGVIVAMVLCWVIADRRRLVEDAELPASITGTRLLGEVPVMRGGQARALTRFTEMPAPPFGFVAAGLWSNIESGVLVVSGAERDAGVTVTAANIAAAFARDGRRVVVVDADGQGRGLSKLAGVSDGTAGLSDVLTRRAPLEDTLRAIELGDGTSVAVLPAGRREPDLASLLRARSMADTVERLREWYDLVIVDTPPVTSEPEAASLGRYADGVLVVVPRNTRLRRVTRLRERLAVLNVPVLGYVFNRDQHAETSAVRTRGSARA